MKLLRFSTLLMAFIFCASGCVKQFDTEFEEVEVQTEEATLRKTYPPKMSLITDVCDERGNIEKVIITDANYASSVTLDLFSEDGTQYIARHTKANPERLFQLDFIVGNPLAAAKS